MNVFIGLDVSLRSVAMCVLKADGDVVEEVNLDCEVGAISDHIRSRGYSVERIGFEAGTMSQPLFPWFGSGRLRGCLHGSPPSTSGFVCYAEQNRQD